MVRSSAPKLGPAQRKKWLQILQPHDASPESGLSSPRYRVVIDTNVWVSGLLYGGTAQAVIALAMSRHEIVCSDYIVDELMAYLKTVHPRVSRRWLRLLRLSMEQYCLSVEGAEQSDIRDPKDEPVVALALVGGALIVTGDKDFLEHKGELGVVVMTVSEALQGLQ